ncbi:quinoprotein dehydrogenase-associated SoxYZ-like carrier [Hyphomicrobium methylovorum]|uniref:quinoprotein dehydrogenase-associated SoxYZ-like carrier n=1 Tax=Hyphomicrobium methylovorum TaxID=84 RepID=UPI0015E73453|nr:quinoprotein dehydrogenase-associated SoxYZ-like carrier [Hyphomicrobium methylovorum]MBA2124974.1 quinoprotein dehydrogenase-associated SoxYZ-like carrier [Hyphomicrobium methylovorum]
MRSAAIKPLILGSLAAVFTAGAVFAAAADDRSETWDSIRKDMYGTRQIEDGTGKIALETPIRAEDGAVVPISVRLPADFAKDVKSLTIIIDKNPAPLAATFTYGEAAGSADRVLSTRIRVDQYSDVRAIAEKNDGSLFMTTNFVKASGGCSAPASKDAEEAAKSLGKMLIKTTLKDPADPALTEAQVMIRHPNTSGMAMDPVTHGYPPPRFLSKISVKTGGKLVFAVEGGISLSEDPNFRFTYQGNPSDVMEVQAEDSMGTELSGHSTPSQS